MYAPSQIRIIFALSVLLALSFIWAPHAAAERAVPLATGTGHLMVGDGENQIFRPAAFNLRLHNGTVRGELHLFSRAIDQLVARIEIDCFSLVDGEPFGEADFYLISGIITKLTAFPFLVGFSGIIAVRDNGEGANDPPDDTSELIIALPGFDCEDSEDQIFVSEAFIFNPDRPEHMRELVAGNIQIF